MKAIKILFFFQFFISSSLWATSEKAKNILETLEKLYRREQSFAKVTMNIYKPYLPGSKRSVSMRIWSKSTKLMLIKIDKPIKDQGISTLRIGKNMWNYFPKIDKTMKLSASMMMGSWMGSDFSNDDLVKESSLLTDYNFTFREDTKKYYLNLTPKDSDKTLWSKIEIIVNKNPLLPMSYSYFNEDNEKTRILTFSDTKTYENIQIPSRLVMSPLDRPKERTEIIYNHMKFNENIDKKFFSLRNLKRQF